MELHTPVMTPDGEGFFVDYARNKTLALCMVKSPEGWYSKHFAVEHVEPIEVDAAA